MAMNTRIQAYACFVIQEYTVHALLYKHALFYKPIHALLYKHVHALLYKHI